MGKSEHDTIACEQADGGRRGAPTSIYFCSFLVFYYLTIIFQLNDLKHRQGHEYATVSMKRDTTASERERARGIAGTTRTHANGRMGRDEVRPLQFIFLSLFSVSFYFSVFQLPTTTNTGKGMKTPPCEREA